MTRVWTKVLVAGLSAAILSGCQVQKSANPLSPAVAGPIEGVVISNPKLLEPGQDWEMKTRDQPLQLLIENADSNGERPLKYSFEVASDAEFKKIVFARTGIEPGAGGLTRLQLPDKLAAGTYWWRTRAEDGANTGPYSPVKSFQVLAEVILAPPVPSSPSNGSTVSDLTPAFRVKAGNRSGVTADIDYVLQVSNNSAFTSIAATFTQKETWPETTMAGGYSFLHSKTYYWRVRAWHTADGSDLSNWSSTMTFRTPAPPAAPPPPPSGSGGGGGGGSNPNACNSSNGDDIAECIESRYPAYLAAGVSGSRRKANMEFLRDRMIEHGKCRGLDLGLNLKRGGPTISSDFIVWRRPGQHDVGVDIGSAYDDTSRRLSLSWHTYSAADNYGFPYYKNYGSANCSLSR
ncbi:MAG: hypothetical protein EHM55_21705 [Acidobacteria bacterium]|nr:MAG: hypothetical protein EHM55_21705 [Acidobacteriota bacterium]